MNNFLELMASCEPKLDVDKFNELHTDYIVPLNIYIPPKQFEKEIKKYHNMFRQWGPYHTNFPRYGLPLVNLTGNLNDEIDPSCMPLDVWCNLNPDDMYLETDFNQSTEVMSLPSLSELSKLSKYMKRSNILWWNNTGHFKPHVDMIPEAITHLRLWGTNKTPDEYYFKYGNHKLNDFEPGRIYLVNTLKQHEAFAISDYVYTYFIALSLESIPKLKELIL